MILSDGSPSISITAGKSLFFSPRTRSETRNGSRNIDDSPSYNGVTYKNSSWECSITTKLGFLNRLCSGTKHNYGMHHIRANRLKQWKQQKSHGLLVLGKRELNPNSSSPGDYWYGEAGISQLLRRVVSHHRRQYPEYRLLTYVIFKPYRDSSGPFPRR